MTNTSTRIDFMKADLMFMKTTPIQINQKGINFISVLGVIVVMLFHCLFSLRLKKNRIADEYASNFINTLARINAEIILNEFKRIKQIL